MARPGLAVSALAIGGTLKYNGLDLSGADLATKSFSIRPVLSSDGRTIIYSTITISVEFTLASGAGDNPPYNTTANMLLLRQKLLEPRRALYFQANGCGDIVINTGDNIARDCCWGPVPKLLSWKANGTASCKVAWSVEVHMPTCGDAAFVKQLLEFVLKVDYTIDRSGLTTRKLSGRLVIPLTVASSVVLDNTPDATADDWRDRIGDRFPPVPGFRRIPGTFSQSEDQRTLTFGLTDEQLPSPNPLPFGQVDASASHSITSTQAMGKIGTWNGTISATYETALDKPRVDTFKLFKALLKDRLNKARQAALASSYFLRTLTLSEPQIYGKTSATYTATYSFVVNKDKLLLGSGLWRKTPKANGAPATHDEWQTSLGGVIGVRGLAGWQLDPEAFVIVDLCNPVQPRRINDPRGFGGGGDGNPESAPPWENDPPDPETSWMDYELALAVEQTDETVEMKYLPTQEIDLSPSALSVQQTGLLSIASVPPVPNITTAAPIQRSTKLPTIEAYRSAAGGGKASGEAEVRALPSLAVWLVGHAMRYGFPIQPPSILSVAGVKVLPQNRGPVWIMKQTGNYFGVPVYAASWRFRYLLPQFPTGSEWPIPENPWLG
jgi:hypothetical protein